MLDVAGPVLFVKWPLLSRLPNQRWCISGRRWVWEVDVTFIHNYRMICVKKYTYRLGDVLSGASKEGEWHSRRTEGGSLLVTLSSEH